MKDALVMAVGQNHLQEAYLDCCCRKTGLENKAQAGTGVSTNDRMIPPETEEFFANRMNAKKSFGWRPVTLRWQLMERKLPR